VSLQAFLSNLVALLEEHSVDYMVCGSVASIFHGVPRTTQDVDLVVSLTALQARRLAEAIPDDRFYISVDAAVEAVRQRRQFNIIDMETAWKADFIVQKAREFSQQEFARRVQVEFLGTKLWLASAEDTVLAKLEWAKQSKSDRQLRDVLGILQVQGAAIDTSYLQRWAVELGVGEELAQALAQSTATGEH
jgi:hypothetical protein